MRGFCQLVDLQRCRVCDQRGYPVLFILAHPHPNFHQLSYFGKKKRLNMITLYLYRPLEPLQCIAMHCATKQKQGWPQDSACMALHSTVHPPFQTYGGGQSKKAFRLSTVSNWRPYPFNCMKLHNFPLPLVQFTLMSWQVSSFVLLQLLFVLCTS